MLRHNGLPWIGYPRRHNRSFLSEKEAILSATLHASILLGEQENIGSISKGRLADIIAVSGNPLEDITYLESVDFVMKDGNVVKKP